MADGTVNRRVITAVGSGLIVGALASNAGADVAELALRAGPSAWRWGRIRMAW